MPQVKKHLFYAMEGSPICIVGWGTPPRVGDLFPEQRVKAIIPVPSQPDALVVIFSALPK